MNYGKTRDSIAEYHAAGCLSSTKLKTFASSPLLYFQKFISREIPKDDDTHEFLIGHSSHTLLLEGEGEYAARYFVVPEGVGKQKLIDKEFRAKLAKENPGKIELSFDDDALNRRMVNAVLSHKEAARLLAGGEAEVTWRLRGEFYDVQARTDKFNVNGWPDGGFPYIVDFKSCASLKDDNPKSFKRTFWGYDYLLSAALYREVVATILGIPADLPRPRFYWIAAEKEPPFQCEVFEADDFAYEVAGKQLEQLLSRMRECYKTGEWPGSPETIQTLTPPAWFVKRVLDDGENLI